MSTKRTEEIAAKLFYPENRFCRSMLQTWLEESLQYANKMMECYGPNAAQKEVEGFQVLFLMNKICPNLVHRCHKPDARMLGTTRDASIEYAAMMRAHTLENTQVGFSDENGNTIQEGVAYDRENLDAFLKAIQPLLKKHFYFFLGKSVANTPYVFMPDGSPKDGQVVRRPGYISIYASGAEEAKEMLLNAFHDQTEASIAEGTFLEANAYNTWNTWAPPKPCVALLY